ncbi:hypothetical protein PTKIN_Ptkin08bG0162400 [Pterospermum kingtungense]
MSGAVAMSVHLLASVPSSSFISRNITKGTGNRSNPDRSGVFRATKFVASANVSDKKIVRRSANYHPPIWDYDYIQSLKSDYLVESCNERASRLVGEVRMMLDKVMDPLEKLEIVDTLQSLGLSYHFHPELKNILESIWADQTKEVFSSFMDQLGNFKAGLCEDCKGLLSLYEASYLPLEGEVILDKARDFAAEQLQEHLKQKKLDEYHSMLVDHALELPLHWRVLRLEARWFVDVYERKEDGNPILLELAKLDFNIVQAVHQNDLRYASEWWRNIGLGEKLTFARDRLMENFLWTVGVAPDPQFGNGRRILAKVNSLITTIDDVYDVYGTLDELELFTEAVERWDVNAMELLPEYMKICFLALYNCINEIAFDTLKEQGIDTIPFLKRMWEELCKAYLVEAKWYYSGYIPTFKEYINNAWISIAAPEISLKRLEEHSNIIYCTSMILRLADDLGTSSDELKRGDVPKSIQCYMNETGCSEEEAPRMAECMYQHGDGHGVEYRETKDRVFLLLVRPIAYGRNDN